MTLVAARHVAARLNGQEVLHGIDLALEPGEIVTVVGPNGSGKTTLLRVLIGAVSPAAGRIERAPGLRIGYVPQRLAIDPTLPISVGRFLRLPGRRDRRAVAAALHRVGVGDLHDRPMAELSGGQFQRVLLARALLNAPQLLLLDEPTQALDQPGTAAFYALVAALRAELGCAVLMVSHDLHVVMQAADRVICLNGHICCQGTPTVVSAAPEYRALFGTGTGGALALYQHHHDHRHDAGDGPAHGPAHGPGHAAGASPDHDPRHDPDHGAGRNPGDGAGAPPGDRSAGGRASGRPGPG